MSVSMKPRVYLAGPIKGLDYAGAIAWRDYAISKLAPEITAFSPLRGKSFQKDTGIIKDSVPEHVMATDRAIMVRDHFDCTGADVLLVNFLGATSASLGTAMEMAWAYDHHIPVVCAMEPKGNPHDHPMLRESITYRVDSLDEAIALVKMVLLPVSH